MQTFVGTPTTVATIEYHAASFNFERIDLTGIRDDFAFLENVRTRRISVPAAGSDTLRLIIEFIGTNAVAGIIGYLEGKILDKVFSKVKSVERHSSGRYAMPFTGIKLVYEDVEIHIEDVMSLDETQLRQILEQILSIMSDEKNLPINRIDLPIMYANPFFRLWSIQRAENDPGHFRYWHLSPWGNGGEPKIYDSKTKKTITYDQLGHYYDLSTDEVYELLERLVTDQDYGNNP